MDFLDEQCAGEAASERGASALPQIEGAVSQTIARAIRDATQTTDPVRQQEAASWLWICCPDIAEQVELPEPNFDTMSHLATSYVDGKTVNGKARRLHS